MQSYAHHGGRRLGGPALALIALCLTAVALIFGDRASAAPPYPPPPAATSVTSAPTGNTHADHAKHAESGTPVRARHTTKSNTTSNLADTGFATTTAVGIVALLLVGGGLLLYLGKRRDN
jgi:uncharacterized membrane protein